MAVLKYTRLYEDEHGESHFEDAELELRSATETRGATEVLQVVGLQLTTHGADYNLPPHPAPRRQFILKLSGTVEVQASDGEVRRFGPGSIQLVEDTKGKGHTTRAVGDEPGVSAFVHLGE